MKTKEPNFGLGVQGDILGCRTELMIARENDGWSYAGYIYVENGRKNIIDFLSVLISEETAKNSREYEGFIGGACTKISVSHRKNISCLKIQNGAQMIAALSMKEGAVLLATFQKSEVEVKEGRAYELLQALNRVGAFLGVEQFTFFLKTGNQNIESIAGQAGIELPEHIGKMTEYQVFVYGKFDFRQSGMAFRAIFCQLFGLEIMEVFLAYQKADKEFAAYLMLPLVDNKWMYCENMYFYMKIRASEMGMGIRGEFLFRFLGDMKFVLNAAIPSLNTKASSESFLLAAHSCDGYKFELISGFYIQDTALLIGYNGGFTFGLLTRLGIRKLELFAGIKLTVYGEVINLSLITAAIHQLSLPMLVDNVLGVHISGIEIFDFIEINSFDLHVQTRYESDKDVVDYINQSIAPEEWKLSKKNTQVREQKDGLAILDEKRMCHYFIDKEGKLSLQAQFYYAAENCEIGNYCIKKGIFVCGVLTVFGKSIKALLSMKDGEGVIAFAQTDKIDLGFLKISASTASAGMTNPILESGNSALAQFVDTDRESAVFFLSAGHSSCSFYLDGKIELCGLLSLDARIIYRKGLISVDTKCCLCDAVEMYIKLEVSYEHLLDGRFSFYCSIDTRKLEQKLTAVREKLQEAIEKCRKSIADATRALDDAKARVNNLYCEIRSLDDKIEGCRREIQRASWWKRWIVAIYKGSEILAYEVAKGALYVAIGTAKAVLEVAKAAVQFGGIMGEGVLRIAQGVVDASLNLFFLRRIELAVEADKSRQSIGGSIEFVAFGKEYKYKTSFSASIFGGHPENEIAGNINKRMENDLNNIDKGAFKSNRDKYHIHENLKKDRQHLQVGMGELEHAADLLADVQGTYVKEAKEMMPEFASLHNQYEQSVSGIENTMAFIAQSIKINELKEPMQTLEQAAKEEKVDQKKAQETLNQYREAKTSYEQLYQNIEKIREMRRTLETGYEEQKQRSDRMMQAGETGTEKALENVVNQVEASMCMKHFRATPKDSGYINLSKERVIEESFASFREQKDYDTPEEIRDVRKKTRNIKYTRRL